MLIITSPGQIAFNISSFPIYNYGICIAAATLIGFSVSYFIAKKNYKEYDTDILYDIVFIAIIGGLIFARLYYCILNFEYYSNHIFEIINFRQGGLAIHGGLIGGLMSGAAYCKFKKYPILKSADIFAYGLPIAQAIGRWGNFFNSEAYGLPSKHFIAVFIPENARIAGYEFYKYFHPTFLYESILNILIFFVLYFIVRKVTKPFDGLIFASYLILYSVIRYFIEGLRLDSIVNVGALHIPQLVCIITIVIASTFIIYKRKTYN